jgi:hypothetical protein
VLFGVNQFFVLAMMQLRKLVKGSIDRYRRFKHQSEYKTSAEKGRACHADFREMEIVVPAQPRHQNNSEKNMQQPPVRVVISMKSNTCTIMLPQSPVQSPVSELQSSLRLSNDVANLEPQSPGSSPTRSRSQFSTNEQREGKALVANQNKFKKKTVSYDNMITHFSFK